MLRSFNQSWQAVFREGVLDHSTKELARVFIAMSLDCGYCAGQRSHLAIAAGLTEREFVDVIEFRESDVFTPREKAALLFAEAIAWDPGLADHSVWTALHAEFTEPEIVELGYFIGLTIRSAEVPQDARHPARRPRHLVDRWPGACGGGHPHHLHAQLTGSAACAR